MKPSGLKAIEKFLLEIKELTASLHTSQIDIDFFENQNKGATS